MKHLITSSLLVLITVLAASQDVVVYPTHWWTGMKWSNLQLIIHSTKPDTNLGTDKPVITVSGKEVRIVKVVRPENPHYLFVDIALSPTAKPQKVKFTIAGKTKNESTSFDYEFKSRNQEDGKARIQGVTQADLIYLLMPDRFANGDSANDVVAGMRDPQHDRNNPFDRHGGDLQGIEDHLDYLKELGVTTIWPTPVVENDMARTTEGGVSRSTYHGYAFTDQYQIDRRFGGNERYLQLVNAAHKKGLKFIQDAVYNHVGADHWSIRDMPAKDWVHQWPVYTNTSYKEQPIVDPHAAAIDRQISLDGWFTPFLADLNQRNPYVSNFLIQYAIWATEEFGIDGWRVDTYFYSDSTFLNKINVALKKEFPKLTVFGETLVPDVLNAAYFAQNNLDVRFRHNAPGITDFPLCNAILAALKKPEDVFKLYSTLAMDILYKDPTRNCIFFDNHDLDRMYSVAGEDFKKYKMAVNWLLTLRGIPQLYYGTEILMKNLKNPTDAEVRKDFPGGWSTDPVNKFTKAGRTESEDEAFRYVAALANFRKSSPALTTGRLMQYVPKNNAYVYFRYETGQTVMIMSNSGTDILRPDWNYYRERTGAFTKARNVITGETISLIDVQVKPTESFVFELLK